MTDDELIDMTTVDGMEAAISATAKGAGGAGMRGQRVGTPNGTFCPRCGAVRRMRINVLSAGPRQTTVTSEIQAWTNPKLLPALFELTCVQCGGTIAVVVFNGPEGVEAAALPSSYGGLSTPNTPKAVAYYLDQAQRSQAVGASSAAVSMYRAALEQLLFEQGYQNGMLAKKIQTLEADGNAPEWFRDLDSEFLRVMKDLGNAAIHPNDGDIERQEAFDKSLLLEVRALFVELLDDVYEQPVRRAQRLTVLKDAKARVERSDA